MESRKAVFAVIGAGILWGVISLFIRPLSAAGLDPMQIASVRMVTASVLFLCVIAVRSPGKLRVRVRDLWMFAGTGIVSVSLFNFCYFYTIIYSSPIRHYDALEPPFLPQHISQKPFAFPCVGVVY